MSVRRRTLLIVVAAIVGFAVVSYVASLAIVRLSYARVETQLTQEHLRRAKDALDAELAQLSQKNQDWAASDSASAFVQGLDPSYRARVLTPANFDALRVNFMVYLDNTGTVVRAQTFDKATGNGVPAPDGLLADLGQSSPLIHPPGGAHSIAGILSLPRGPVLVSSHAILNGQHQPPSRGTLVMGRYLDAGEIAYLSTKAGEPVKLQAAAANASGAGVLKDVFGKSAAALTVGGGGGPSGAAAGWYLLLAFVLAGGLFGALAAMVIAREVPEAETEAPAAATQPTVAPTQAGAAAGPGSGAAMTGAVASTAGAAATGPPGPTQSSEDSVAKASAELTRQVHERTALLSQANEALTSEIAERKKIESAMRESEARYRGLVENMGDAVFVVNRVGKFDYASPHAMALTGYSQERFRQMSYRDLVAPSSRERVERQLALPPDGAPADPCEATFMHANGRTVDVELSASHLLSATGELTGVQWIARDITDRKRLEFQLGHMASHDYLTGLYNRRRFEEELSLRLAEARRHKTEGSLIWLDLDRFKELNDSLGHRAGDELLIRVANSLQEACRAENVLARMGGDEFALLMPHTTPEEAQQAAERMLSDLRAKTFSIGGHSIKLTGSVGVARFPWHGTTVHELLARADLAMYRAKQEGRDRFCVYRKDEDWQKELKARRSWAEKIERALAHEDFEVYAQPIVDPKTKEVLRHELLVRMKGDEGETIPPAAFLETAEDLGLIRQIDRWMIHQAVGLIAQLRALGRVQPLDVNLSATAFTDEGLLDHIEAELESARVDPALLGLEISETAAVGDMGKAVAFIGRLKRIGCRFALDNFGSGFSSFSYLKHMPVDVLKIDGSLIQNLPRNPRDQHLVKAIVELAKGMGVKTGAEYVEEAETLELLKSYGVDYAQGYHLGRPGPASEIT